MELVRDMDGFFWPASIVNAYMRKQRKFISIDREHQPLDTLFEQYYLGFRNSLFICEDTVKDKQEALKALRTWSEGCLHSAWSYVAMHKGTKQSLPVDFMWISRSAIIHKIKSDYPKAKKIKLRLSMKPRLSARAVDKGTIVFPALTRTMLNHCNLVIINSIFRFINNDGQIIGDVDRRQTARYIFPYLLFCHDDFSVRNLPIIGAHSKDAVSTAISFTNLQIIFILAHEYAHILLKHLDEENITDEREMEMENEADEFALKVVLSYIQRTDGAYSNFDVLTAIRWLFKYQLMDNSIGTLSKGNPVDFNISKIEDRRGIFQIKLMNDTGLKGSTLLESLGFCMLVEAQGLLYEFGTELINKMIDVFHESAKTGTVEPWWEEIDGSEYSPGQMKKVVEIFNESRIKEE